MHATAFEAGFYDQFVRVFHRAITNRPASGLKRRVLHLICPFVQIRHGFGQCG